MRAKIVSRRSTEIKRFLLANKQTRHYSIEGEMRHTMWLEMKKKKAFAVKERKRKLFSRASSEVKMKMRVFHDRTKILFLLASYLICWWRRKFSIHFRSSPNFLCSPQFFCFIWSINGKQILIFQQFFSAFQKLCNEILHNFSLWLHNSCESSRKISQFFKFSSQNFHRQPLKYFPYTLNTFHLPFIGCKWNQLKITLWFALALISRVSCRVKTELNDVSEKFSQFSSREHFFFSSENKNHEVVRSLCDFIFISVLLTLCEWMQFLNEFPRVRREVLLLCTTNRQ